MEKRALSRVAFQTAAAVRCGDRDVEGQVENLSLHGAFIATTEQLPADAVVDLAIQLNAPTSQLTINCTGAVVRTEDRGFGVEFREMGLDSFVHLKNVVSYQNGDPQKIVSEFAAFLANRAKGQ